ncbi:MAG: UDP-N-acetylglucosamine 1-carboxyvinyltransferase [Candidatus Dojkabacteria bacterium]|nr:MAG: UDP-N-acetylglucosamine 1-carboxyvinyltransferase [Candidatus Dojkabacteria bacterium]
MTTYKIVGGEPISGTVTPMPNKNSIVALIPAAVLADEPVVFSNVPMSSSVRVMLRIFRKLGGKVSYLKDGKIKLDASTINYTVVDKELAKKERASIMFLGPLVSRFGEAEFGQSGGCKLGSRPIDTLLQGLTNLGAKIDPENIFHITANGLKGNDKIWQLETSVTGTENLVIAAVKAEGRTVIYNAACEPHVQDLCNFFNSIGADIRGVGTNRLEINGVEKLRGGEWSVIPDFVDIGGLIVAAAITGGELTIKNAIPDHMQHILMFYDKISLKYNIDGDSIHIPAKQKLECKPNAQGDMDKITAQPWPTGFPADLIPQALVLAASAGGNIRIQNMMYETQLNFVDTLNKMRAKIALTSPNQAITFGPSQFKGTVVSAPDILQCAHAVALAAFAAKGETKILNADIINRRYPEFVSTFKKLGAKIAAE